VITIFDDIKDNLTNITPDFVMNELLNNLDVIDLFEKEQVNQFDRNETPQGGSLGEYAKRTQDVWNEKRQTKITWKDPIILKDTGKFRDGIYVDVDEIKTKEVMTLDALVDDLYKSPDNILGLNEESYGRAGDEIVRKGYAHDIIEERIMLNI
jgi:hypothetical protein